MIKVKQKNLTSYEINVNTMAILPYLTKDNQIISKVIEVEDVFHVLKTPTEIISESCEYFGVSYRGRKDGTKKLIGVTHKSPIAVSSSQNLFFLPTTSSKAKECAWISHVHVDLEKCKRISLHRTLVYFANDLQQQVHVSLGSLRNQLNRTAQLRAAHINRTLISQENTFSYIKEEDIPHYLLKDKNRS